MKTLLLLMLSVMACNAQLSVRNPAYVAAVLKPAAGGAAPSFPSGTIWYWPLGEASGNTRFDVNSGSEFNEVTTAVGSTTGKSGDAANWPPGTGTLVSTFGFADLSNPLSISFWVNVDNLPLSSASIMQGLGSEDPYVNVTSGGNLNFGNDTDGDLATVALGAMDSWHLIVITISVGGTMKTYLDGSLVDTDTPTNPPNGNNVELGEIATLDAAIDECGMWQRELSGTEVADIWNAGTGTFGP